MQVLQILAAIVLYLAFAIAVGKLLAFAARNDSVWVPPEERSLREQPSGTADAEEPERLEPTRRPATLAGTPASETTHRR